MTRPLNAIEVARAVHERARPMMQSDAWCVNAAGLTRDVLRRIGVASFASACDVIHMNAAFVWLAHEDDPDQWPETVCPPGQDPYTLSARVDGHAAGTFDIEPKPQPGGSLDGHVLTYVPDWQAWIDPSAPQFNRPERGVLITEPMAWLDSPPEGRAYLRDDGGMTAICAMPTRRFVNSSAWQRRAEQRYLVDQIVADLAG